MDARWDENAACRGKDPALWFPEGGGDQGVEAKRICRACPVREACLAWAIERNESEGIWGGLTFDRRQKLRRLWDAGDALAYRSEFDAVIAGRRRVRKAPQVCGRCGDPVRVLTVPEDRNGPNARCGNVGTYNRGCRCDRCREAKADAKAGQSPRAG